MNGWHTVGIVGAGTMGSGIAQVAAEAGCQVVLVDASVQVLDRSESELKRVLARQVEKGRRTAEEIADLQSRIQRTTDVSQLASCDMVLEAIVEDLEAKSKLFQTLESLVSPTAVLATNTSSLSVTALAQACAHPERVLGLHFFNPAPLMKLVEVVPALQTSSLVAQTGVTEMTAWGKVPALAKDTPGFIVNRVARPFYSEALRLLDEGMAEVQDIDASMRAQGFRMGPFELMDLIGHDVNYAVTSTVHAAFYGDSRYRPSHTQRQLVAAKWLGRKTGRGFYHYESGEKQGDSGKVVDGVAERILLMLMNEAADAVFWQVATAHDVDQAMQNGVNYPKGLLAWADSFGLEKVVHGLDSLHERYGEERYRVSPLLRDMARRGDSFYT